MQLVDAPHQRKIDLGDHSGQVVHVRVRDLQQFGLPVNREIVGSVDHFFTLASSKRPSATAKKSISNACWPILACMSFTLGPVFSRFSAGVRNTPMAASINCARHWAIWLPCRSNFSASSAKVLSSFKAATATFALNAAV